MPRVAMAVLMARARAGDGDAFQELTEPHRAELQVHCYRMLGSVQDAEDIFQDTLLAAWQGIGGFDGRSSLRTWLYRIATNRCLNARRSAGRRARYERTEAISLAFVTALQVLPPRQVAVLVLRDVLGFSANEVAEMLDSTVESVKSALKRARAGLQRRLATGADREPPPAADSAVEESVVANFVRAYESADIDALVALLTDDVFMSMPPLPFEYEGRAAVARLCTAIFRSGRRFDLVPTRANGHPAFGAYLSGPTGIRHGTSLLVLDLSGNRICAMTRFDSSVFPSFGLPRSLPSR